MTMKATYEKGLRAISSGLPKEFQSSSARIWEREQEEAMNIGGLPSAMQSRTATPMLDPMYVQGNNHGAVVFKGDTDPAAPGAAMRSFYSNPLWRIAMIVSSGASAYHGYRRNNSLGWGIGWGLLGGMFPAITPSIALAQGFGKPAKK
jgi:hypothetical protein